MRVNLSDIAQHLGVSVYTVSSALNDKGRISQKMRELIKKTAGDMGYQPSAAARILKSPRLSDIGLLIFEHAALIRKHPGFQDLNVQFTKECQALGIRHQFEWFSPANAADQLPALLCDGLIGGVLIAGMVPDRVQTLLNQEQMIPYVQVGEAGAYSLRFDPSAAVEDALRHLTELGHRSLMLVNGPTHIPVYQAMRDTVNNWMRRQSAQEIPYYCEIDPSAPAQEQVASVMRTLRATAPQPTALFVAGGPTAKSVIACLLSQGVRVPQDLSVVCFEVMDWEAEDFFLPITTVEHDFSALTKQAVRLLRARMSGADIEQRNLLIPERFVIRKTTAPRKDPA